MPYPDPHPGPHVVPWADWIPTDPDDVPTHLLITWARAATHLELIDELWGGRDGMWPPCPQLTTGAENWCFECEAVHPPGHHTDPEPCCCSYHLHTVRLPLGVRPGEQHPRAVTVVVGSAFMIKPRCVHHGDYLREQWADVPTGLPWETTLGPDETQP